MLFGFEKMFDFNNDGKLDAFERGAEYQFLDFLENDVDGEQDDESEDDDLFGFF